MNVSVRLPALLFAVILLGPALGLVNVAPITKPTAQWASAARGRGAKPLFSAPTVVDESPLQATKTTATEAPSQRNNANNIKKTPQLKGMWMPPSQNAEQRRGNVFAIRQPEDLLDFVLEDERLSVVKVYASWCKTCQQFDMRYRKIASQYGDKYNDSKTTKSTQISKKGRARFAEMELKDHNEAILNSIISKSNQPISLPYILMYKGSKGKVKDFNCTPKQFKVLADAVDEFADPVVAEGDSESAVTNGNNSE